MTSPAGQNPPASTASQTKKTRKMGDYELTGKLGQGAMGSVYLARHNSTGRQCALKVLPVDLARDEEFLERFRREARAAQRLSHPNIVAAYDVGVADGYNYIAMEFVDGPNTEIMLQRKGRFAPQVALKIGLDMSGAFEAAEAAGIVHRDIKPANILVNSQGVAKLTDLGLASASHGDRRVTMAGFCVGTPYYIAPEQARGEANVDGRADIYSLGATLYHLVTGTLPFPGANPVVIMTKHLQEMPPPPHVREPSVPAPVSALIMKMMAKDPAQRPQNAAQLRGDLERALRGEMPLPANGAALPSDAAGSSSIAARDAVPLLDRLFTLADKLLPFVPAVIRLPVAAVVITVVVIAILWAAVVLSRS